jgi:hypothetical protein
MSGDAEAFDVPRPLALRKTPQDLSDRDSAATTAQFPQIKSYWTFAIISIGLEQPLQGKGPCLPTKVFG